MNRPGPHNIAPAEDEFGRHCSTCGLNISTNEETGIVHVRTARAVILTRQRLAQATAQAAAVTTELAQEDVTLLLANMGHEYDVTQRLIGIAEDRGEDTAFLRNRAAQVRRIEEWLRTLRRSAHA